MQDAGCQGLACILLPYWALMLRHVQYLFLLLVHRLQLFLRLHLQMLLSLPLSFSLGLGQSASCAIAPCHFVERTKTGRRGGGRNERRKKMNLEPTHEKQTSLAQSRPTKNNPIHPNRSTKLNLTQTNPCPRQPSETLRNPTPPNHPQRN